MEPNKENIRKWVSVLRGGNFIQGYSTLNKDNRFCCLGVACEVAINNGIVLNKETTLTDTVCYNRYTSTLPPQVREWLGLDNYEVSWLGDKVTLVALNDKFKLTFNQIATLIEDTYLKD